MKVIERREQEWWIGRHTCPVCGSVIELEHGDFLSEAMKWHGPEVAELQCPVCGGLVRIVAFRAKDKAMGNSDPDEAQRRVSLQAVRKAIRPYMTRSGENHIMERLKKKAS